MLNAFIQNARRNRGHGLTSMFRHLGALGLFFLAILDGSPLPTFGGPDILTAILAASHRNPWYEYAAVATGGSVIVSPSHVQSRTKGRIGLPTQQVRKSEAGCHSQLFSQMGNQCPRRLYSGTFPFPTNVFFGVAGASNYGLGRFLTVVTICRAARYGIIAVIADHYGRNFIRALRQPGQYWGWLLLFAAVIFSLIIAGILLNRRLAATTSA